MAEGYTEFRLEFIAECNELHLLLGHLTIPELALIAVPNAFRTDLATLVHEDFSKLGWESRLGKTVQSAVHNLLKERVVKLREQLELVSFNIRDGDCGYISSAQRKKQDSCGYVSSAQGNNQEPIEGHLFDNVDKYIWHLCRAHVPNEFYKTIGERDSGLWKNIFLQKEQTTEPEGESNQEIRMYTYYNAFTVNRHTPYIFLVVQRMKNFDRVAAKIARNTTQAALERRRDRRNGVKRTTQEYLKDAIIKDMAGITIVTPNEGTMRHLEDDLVRCLEVSDTNDYYNHHKEGSLLGYRARTCLVQPHGYDLPDKVRLQLCPFEAHLNNAIGVANHMAFMSSELAELPTAYHALDGRLRELFRVLEL